MNDRVKEAIAFSLGNPDRDFKTEPLTDNEIQAIIVTYSKELKRSDLDLELREIYKISVELLKNHLLLH